MAENVKITISAIDKTKKAFNGVTNGLKTVAKAAFSMKGALVAAAGPAAVGLLIRQSLTAVDTLKKTADKIGTTTEALSALQYAAEISGVTVETVNMAAQRFTRRLAEAAKGTGEAKDALLELNINAEELKKKSLDEQMLDLADAFADVQNSADKVRLAMKLFDSEGVALVNTLAAGRKGLKELFLEADELGLVLSTRAATGVEKANDALLRLFKLGTGLRNQIVANLAPAIESLSTTLKDKFLKDIKAAGGSVEEFGLILAEKLLQGLANILYGFADAARGIAEFANSIIEMLNYVRDWMGLTPIATQFTGAFGDSIDNLAGNIWRAKMGLRGLHDEASSLADDEYIPNYVEHFGEALKDVADKLNDTNLKLELEELAKTMSSTITQGFTDAITGAKSFGDAMKSMAKTVVDALIKMMVQYYITKPILEAFGGALGIPTTQVTKQSAIGGSQNRGQATWVGERGPELFVPNQNGSIIPNNKLGSGGGVVVNQTINVTTGVQQTVRAEIATLMPQIANAAKGAVADARQRGGGFSKALVGA
jgi:hypothetical protein